MGKTRTAQRPPLPPSPRRTFHHHQHSLLDMSVSSNGENCGHGGCRALGTDWSRTPTAHLVGRDLPRITSRTPLTCTGWSGSGLSLPQESGRSPTGRSAVRPRPWPPLPPQVRHPLTCGFVVPGQLARLSGCDRDDRESPPEAAVDGGWGHVGGTNPHRTAPPNSTRTGQLCAATGADNASGTYD